MSVLILDDASAPVVDVVHLCARHDGSLEALGMFASWVAVLVPNAGMLLPWQAAAAVERFVS